MLLLEAFLTSLVLVGASELGDKAQLTAWSLLLKFRKKRARVFAGTVLALAVAAAIAVVFGAGIQEFVNPRLLEVGAALLFLGLCVYTLFEWGGDGAIHHEFGKEIDGGKPGNNVFVTAFTRAFVSEFGTKTQLVTVLLTVNYPAGRTEVFLGVVSGIIVVTAISGILGKKVNELHHAHNVVRFVSAASFGLFGMLVLIKNFIIAG